MLKKFRAATAAAAIAALALTACSGAPEKKADKGTEGNPIKIGVFGKSDEQWAVFEKEAKDAGISIELQNFADYSIPNPALRDGDLDINQFQHILFLAQYNKAHNDTLTPIGSTAIYPIGIYSKKYKDVKDIPAGGSVGLPNDETNQGRSLLVLKEAGLIELKASAKAVPAIADVDTAKSKVKLTPMDANQVAINLGDFDAGVINNDFVRESGLTTKDSIFRESADSIDSGQYINVWVTRKADADNPTYKKLIELAYKKEFTDALQKRFSGTAVIVTKTRDELQKIHDNSLAKL